MISIYSFLLTIAVTFSYFAAAAPQSSSDDARVCPNSLALPDPFDVDANDPKAIMTFIGGVAPVPSGSTSFGMNSLFTEFWGRYRPDADQTELLARVQTVRFSSSAVSRLRLTEPAASDARRLISLWRDFLDDLRTPDLTFEQKLERHRHAAVAVPRDADHIVTFLKAEFPELRWMVNSGAYFYFKALYARYLPNLELEPMHIKKITRFDAPSKRSNGRLLLLEWREYVRNVIGDGMIIDVIRLPAKSLRPGDGK